MNINRGLFRFFVIGLLAVTLVVLLTFAYYIFVLGQENREFYRQQFIADLAEPACKEIIEKRGTAFELKVAGCSVWPYFWNRSLELSSNDDREIDLALFDEVLSDYYLEQFFNWDTVQFLSLLLGVYVVASFSLYLAYRIIRWGIAGFKSD